uniref:Uncharacterized protein n=1 Tax=Oryza glumipatula TaxID=40148 RepID=A0A0E0BL99_9ORYZ
MPVASPRIPLASVLHLRHLASSRYRSAAGRFSSTGHRRSLAITRAVKSSLPRFLGSSSRLPVQLPTASPPVLHPDRRRPSFQAALCGVVMAKSFQKDLNRIADKGQHQDDPCIQWPHSRAVAPEVAGYAYCFLSSCYETTQGGCGGMVDNASTKAVLEGMTKANTEGDSSTRCWRAACIIVVYHAWMFQEHLVNCG